MSEQTISLDAECATLERLAGSRDYAALREAARAAGLAFPAAWQPPYFEGRALLELGEDAAAEPLLAETRARFPHLHQVAVLYAYAGARVLEPHAALERWRALAEELPAAPGLAIGYSQALRAGGRPVDAEQAITRALAQLPDCVPLLVQHASLAAERGDWWPEAAARWNAVLALQPNRLDALIGAISALREAGALEEAEQRAEPALAAYPDDAELNTTCAAVATSRGDLPATIARLARAVAARPADEALRMALAGAYQRGGRVGDAEAVLKDGLALTQDSQPMLRAYAEIATQAAKWTDAEERWAEVYERCPPSVATYHFYAEALLGIEAFDEAERILAEGVGFAPTAKPLLIGYARAADRRFDWTESAVRWTALRRAYPGDEEMKALMLEARKQQTRQVNKAAIDQEAVERVPMRGYLAEKQRTIEGPRRDPNFGPTALDLLMEGKVKAAPAPQAKAGLFATIRRLFGG